MADENLFNFIFPAVPSILYVSLPLYGFDLIFLALLGSISLIGPPVVNLASAESFSWLLAILSIAYLSAVFEI